MHASLSLYLLPAHIMTNHLIVVITTLSLSFGACGNVLAEMDGNRMLNETVYGAVDGLFSETERQLISDYFRDEYRLEDEDDRGKKHKKDKKKKGLPPGLAKKDQLPPGLQKQLQRNGTLPPGLAKRDLPADLESRLTPPHEGYERVIADTHVVLVEKATGIIMDIIENIVE
jgi:hypothetical protein